jgi:isopentenyl phosphate kinase
MTLDRLAAVSELVFLKLGGSLLTDKSNPRSLRVEVLGRLANEVAAALKERPGLGLVLGHGSGSFGHVVANVHGTRHGVNTPAQWRGYAETALVAGQLNRLVLDTLWSAGVPVLPLQPSASARCRDGELISLDERPVRVALEKGLVPVVYGDVALDEVRGGTIISTEEIFAYLAPRLCPRRVVLVGEVPGVFAVDPVADRALDMEDNARRVVPEITPLQLPGLAPALGGSRGVDVTGGMLAKVREMLGLVQATPSLSVVQVISGLSEGLLRTTLIDPDTTAGTRIHR